MVQLGGPTRPNELNTGGRPTITLCGAWVVFAARFRGTRIAVLSRTMQRSRPVGREVRAARPDCSRPLCLQLLNGQKIWEIRGRPTQIRGPVVIVKQGTGKAYGIANLVRVLGPLDLDDLVSSPEVPPEERDELQRDGLPYQKTYAYVFTNPQWFEHPMPYRHPNGAVTWVRLPDLDLDDIEYVAPTERELV